MVSSAAVTNNKALEVQNPGVASMEAHPAWAMISHLPVLLVVHVPLQHFRVRDLLHLRPGQTIESNWSASDDVPLKAGVQQLSWGEFETIQGRMAVRLTRLA